MNVGQEQMVAPFTTQANLGNILASINAPSTVNTTQTPSLLQSLTGTGTALSGGLNALYGKEGANKILGGVGSAIAGGLSNVGSNFSNMFNNPIPASSQINPVSNPEALTPNNLPTGATPQFDQSGSYIGYTDNTGNFVDMAQ
jgi:hypothetical protein